MDHISDTRLHSLGKSLALLRLRQLGFDTHDAATQPGNHDLIVFGRGGPVRVAVTTAVAEFDRPPAHLPADESQRDRVQVQIFVLIEQQTLIPTFHVATREVAWRFVEGAGPEAEFDLSRLIRLMAPNDFEPVTRLAGAPGDTAMAAAG